MAQAFDYLILGGGSAGCALAGRLSEDPSLSVALLEAGGRGLSRGTDREQVADGGAGTSRYQQALGLRTRGNDDVRVHTSKYK